MSESMDPLPTHPHDPRLDGWYHTIELAPGVVTRATWDHRSTVDLVGLPQSLAGKTALDVGTAEGFWAFELERRGAAHVTAIDIPRRGDVDMVPRYRATVPDNVLENRDWPVRFATAKEMLGRKVSYKNMSVYAVNPTTLGEFDVVYCGSLLLHLMNPLQALLISARFVQTMLLSRRHHIIQIRLRQCFRINRTCTLAGLTTKVITQGATLATGVLPRLSATCSSTQASHGLNRLIHFR